MAIQVQTVGATDLRLAGDISKANYAAGRSIGGQAGRVMGHTRAMMVRIPATGFTASGSYVMLGRDAGGNGNFNSSGDTVLRIGGSGAGALAFRPSVRYRSGSTNAYAGTNEAEGQYSALPQIGVSPGVWLVLDGIRNTGSNSSPVWRGWCAICQIGSGSPSSALAATAINSAWISGTAGALLRQIFSAAGGTTRTPVGLAIEQVALLAGDFPWDTVNNRPHHDAIAALAGVGANPFLTYETLVAAQNAGSLPYANCDQGLGNLDYHWTLRTLTGGRANSGGAGTATLAINAVVDSNGLVDASDIAPAHWYGGAPAIVDPIVKFTGGRGTRATVASGSYQAGTTAMQRRWINMTTSAVALDWAAVTSFGSGAWSVSDVLPVGRYRLEVRDTNDVARAAASEDWLVGTVILTHGQSGMERAFQGVGGPPGDNNLGIVVASGAQGLLLKLNNQNAGGSSGYAQPQPIVARMRSGETPLVGHGAVLMLNAWNSHNPGEPLLIANMAINGTSMGEWADNGTVDGSDTSWRFMGTIGASAGPPSGNNSGVVESYAALLGRHVDLHLMMWTPGMTSVATGSSSRALYMTGIDARFSNAASAPMAVLPPWRGHREPPDVSSVVSKRQEHLDFVAQLGARGILGPYWADIVSDSASGLHSAYLASGGVPDTNQVGQARLGIGLGWVAAWAFDRAIKAHGPRVVAAWFTDGARNSIQIELGRVVRTLNSAAISNRFWISTDNGANFGQSGFTVALDATGTRAVLSTTGSSFPATDVRVDYARLWPFGPTETPNEANSERLLDGLLYDGLTHRGGTNFAAGVRPGNPCQGTNRVGAGLAGVPVVARGAAKLVATERFTGTRNVTVRMMAADGVTVLRETMLPIVAS
jgi:hypothetical protein